MNRFLTSGTIREKMSPERWRQIQDLFDKARACEPGKRAALLEDVCNGDEELRGEIEWMLAHQDEAKDFIRAPAVDLAAMSLAADPGASMAGSSLGLATGTVSGSYRIESQLGKGGMGVVYRAVDTKLNRPVAIKFLSEDLADAATRRRFQREAQVASSLNHPHILTVHDIGEYEGRQYLVTEFVDGGTLKDWARAEKRTWKQVVELLSGVADGLAAAHSAGILHRDIKPANILVAKNGYAKLADFGLAKLAENARPDVPPTLTEGPTRSGM